MSKPLKLGVSRCLLGEKVRYDGGHKRDGFVADTLGPFVEFVGVCPELECGMGVPREALRLEGDPAAPRLMTHNSRVDWTERMQSWGAERLDRLAEEELCGYIFKSKSPSSGMERIKVYDAKGHPSPKGVGIFARMFMDRFPLLPVEDEGRLHDAGLRENFLVRVFAFHRWRELLAEGLSLGRLVEFHARHKLLLMAHHPETYREMGRLVAKGRELPLNDLRDRYIEALMRGLAFKSTVKKNVNALTHAMGYFKRQLSADEKREMLEVIDEYHRELTPLIVPITLLNHYTRKYGEPYLSRQHYLRPHPAELKLRNHV